MWEKGVKRAAVFCMVLVLSAVCAQAQNFPRPTTPLQILPPPREAPKPDPEIEKRFPPGKLTPPPKGKGWVDLLDEDHAPEWRPNIRHEKLLEVKDSALHIFGTQVGGYVCYTKERLRDFALHIEFKVAANTNSGVILRGETEEPELTGLEIQVLDDHGRDPSRHGCGALYDIATPMFNMSFSAGQWNSLDITCQGRILIVVMNDWKILDLDLSKLTTPVGKFTTPYAQLALDGYLFLQDRGGEVWYRNIFLKKL